MIASRTNTQESTTIVLDSGVTWTKTVLDKVVLCSVFDSIEITVKVNTCDNPEQVYEQAPEDSREQVRAVFPTACWEVDGAKFHHTAQGLWIQGTRKRSFLDEEQAREYANRWFTRLVEKGWRRTR